MLLIDILAVAMQMFLLLLLFPFMLASYVAIFVNMFEILLV